MARAMKISGSGGQSVRSKFAATLSFWRLPRILTFPATVSVRSCPNLHDIPSIGMADAGRTGFLPGLLVGLGGALWLLGVVRVFAPGPVVASALDVLLVGFVLLSLSRIGCHTRVLCLALAGAAAGLAGAYGRWDAIPMGLSKAAVFPAFLATILLLRATADQRPEIAAARRLFATLEKRDQGGGIVVGAHLLGVVLQVGVFAILAPILGREASVEERRRVFLVAIRGMALVPLWSPFVVAMAVGSAHLPAVPLWQIMVLGIPGATIGLLVSVVLFDRGGGAAALWRSLMTLAPVLPPVAVAAFILIGLTTATELSTLQAMIVGMPMPCLLAIALTRNGNVAVALRATAQNLGRIGPETAILTCAMTMGVVFEACLPATGLLDAIRALSLAPAVVVAVVVMAMNIFGLMGLHPIVTGTILLVIFTGIDTGVSELVLFAAMLTGWGLCTAISMGSLSIATGATMFDLPPTRLISMSNIAYVFLTSALIVVGLALLNLVLMPGA